jgi:hypothetical protein
MANVRNFVTQSDQNLGQLQTYLSQNLNNPNARQQIVNMLLAARSPIGTALGQRNDEETQEMLQAIYGSYDHAIGMASRGQLRDLQAIINKMRQGFAGYLNAASDGVAGMTGTNSRDLLIQAERGLAQLQKYALRYLKNPEARDQILQMLYASRSNIGTAITQRNDKATQKLLTRLYGEFDQAIGMATRGQVNQAVDMTNNLRGTIQDYLRR